MAEFNKEELLKIAQLSSLKINDAELNLFVGQIKNILDYVNQLQQVPSSIEAQPTKNINVVREDVAQSFNSATILAQAPEHEGHYFVVPAILEEGKGS